MSNKFCSGCSRAQDVTESNVKQETILIEKGGVVLNEALDVEKGWTFKIVRKCSVGRETVKGFDKCFVPREFSARSIEAS